MDHGIPFTQKPMLFVLWVTTVSSEEQHWLSSGLHHQAFLILSHARLVSAFWKSASGNMGSVLGCTVRLLRNLNERWYKQKELTPVFGQKI
jgi:hypothetical protein